MSNLIGLPEIECELNKFFAVLKDFKNILTNQCNKDAVNYTWKKGSGAVHSCP
jgi:hypothetical protein